VASGLSMEDRLISRSNYVDQRVLCNRLSGLLIDNDELLSSSYIDVCILYFNGSTATIPNGYL
jgi:hypothetical protein